MILIASLPVSGYIFTPYRSQTTLNKIKSDSQFKVFNAPQATNVILTPEILQSYSTPALSRRDAVKKLISSDIPIPKVYINDSVATGIRAMNLNNRGGVLIFDENDKLAGIFTERDFVTKILDLQMESNEVQVGSVMTVSDRLIVGKDDDSLSECRQLMIKYNVRHLPILDQDNNVCGLISMRDIIRSLQQEDILRSSARFAGDTLSQVQEQAKIEANLIALGSGEEGKKQDTLRAAFVVSAAAIGAAVIQGNWIHQHEVLTMWATFVLGYIGIVFETYFEFNKGGIALLMSTALWVIYQGSNAAHGIPIESSLSTLGEKVSEVSEVIFFILGAMTIVEIVDAHQGFKVVTDRIESKDKRGLLWIIGMLTFFMSAILDNLTTTIVMVSLMKKLLKNDEDRKIFGALIVIAANAGGAWTPIGDVTTTMLWINGQITALPTMVNLLFPSLISVLVSLFVMEKYIAKDEVIPPMANKATELAPRGQLVFATGLAGLLSVPAFKAITGLPPYLGMLAALGVMWSLTDAIHVRPLINPLLFIHFFDFELMLKL